MAPTRRRGDGQLWMIAFGLSLVVNLLILAAVGFVALESSLLRIKRVPINHPKSETVATILAEIVPSSKPATAAPTVAAVPEIPKEKPFARTSDDQTAPPEANAAFVGERNTRATSDRAPTPTAPPLPSQKGIDPRHESNLETTRSDYQDGSLSSSPAAPNANAAPTPPPVPDSPAPTEPDRPSESAAMPNPAQPGKDAVSSIPPPREKLMLGPNPVDVQAPRESKADGEIKPTPETRSSANTAPKAKPSDPKQSAQPAKPSTDPAFKGFQRKTAIVGSISRTGRSALAVDDTPLGRYQAAISRAVELEWQRNCVRHRDFITPGFLTVRFFVEPNGKVRSVQFVGEMETGEVQKGFTLNSIRNAGIPAMPAALRKEYAEEPLELTFRFYF